METKIYTLIDPRTGEARYVGKTSKSLAERLRGHYREAKYHRYKRAQWLKGLTAAGLKPEIRLLDVADDGGAEAEMFYIEYLKSLGCRLLNMTKGGDGIVGYKHTKEQCLKQSTKVKTWLAENGHPMQGRTHTPEARAKQSRARKGQVSNRKGVALTQEIKDKMRAAKTKVSISVVATNLATGESARYPSLSEAAKVLNIDRGNARKVLQGEYAQASGYSFKKAD